MIAIKIRYMSIQAKNILTKTIYFDVSNSFGAFFSKLALTSLPYIALMTAM